MPPENQSPTNPSPVQSPVTPAPPAPGSPQAPVAAQPVPSPVAPAPVQPSAAMPPEPQLTGAVVSAPLTPAEEAAALAFAAKSGNTNASTGPQTQADFMKLSGKDRNFNPKKLLIIGGGLALIAVLVVVLTFAGILPFFQLRTVKYDNGHTTYKVKFYAQYEVKPAKDGISSVANVSGDDSEDINALVAKKGKDGKKPLKLAIDSSNDEDDAKIIKDCGGETPAFTAHNKYTDSDVNVCDIGTGGGTKDIVYVASFAGKGHAFAVLMMPDIDFKDVLSSSDKAKEMVKTADLSVYEDDLKTIIGSIKPD